MSPSGLVTAAVHVLHDMEVPETTGALHQHEAYFWWWVFHPWGPFFVIDGALHRVLRCLRTRTYTRIADVDSDHTRTLLFSFIVCLSRLTPASLCLSRPLTTYDTVTLTYCYL